jgi:hypothetical protein
LSSYAGLEISVSAGAQLLDLLGKVLEEPLMLYPHLTMKPVYLINFGLEFEAKINLLTKSLLSRIVLFDKHCFLVI